MSSCFRNVHGLRGGPSPQEVTATPPTLPEGPTRYVLPLMLSQGHQVHSSLMTGSALCCCLILTCLSLRKDLGKQDMRLCRSFGLKQTWVQNKTPVTLNDWLAYIHCVSISLRATRDSMACLQCLLW